jgi:hypothetical protein
MDPPVCYKLYILYSILYTTIGWNFYIVITILVILLKFQILNILCKWAALNTLYLPTRFLVDMSS